MVIPASLRDGIGALFQIIDLMSEESKNCRAPCPVPLVVLVVMVWITMLIGMVVRRMILSRVCRNSPTASR